MTDHPMLERAARAIATAFGDDLDHAFTNKSEWNAARGEKGGRYRDINEPMLPHYFDAARAALTALLEPTPDMVEAGDKASTIEDGCIGIKDELPAIFRAMIHHILKGEE